MNSLNQLLTSAVNLDGYGLALSPGFFQFYSLIGAIHAFQDHKMLKPCCISGASAGALVGGFLSAGLLPNQMIERIAKYGREDFWDVGGNLFSGLLEGKKCHGILYNETPVKTFQECVIPIGITAYDIYRCKTSIIRKGDLITAMRASCCFPVLFQPVKIEGYYHIDGGVFDTTGLMALPNINIKSNLVVSIIFGLEDLSASKLPDTYDSESTILLSIILQNTPRVNPFTMKSQGGIAYRASKNAVEEALKQNTPVLNYKNNHFFVVLDCKEEV